MNQEVIGRPRQVLLRRLLRVAPLHLDVAELGLRRRVALVQEKAALEGRLGSVEIPVAHVQQAQAEVAVERPALLSAFDGLRGAVIWQAGDRMVWLSLESEVRP